MPFALPGGYVYVTRGLLALARNEAELAGVLAHEIGHITARHAAERYGQNLAASLATAGLGILGGSAGGQRRPVPRRAWYWEVILVTRSLNRTRSGVRYLSRAGYNTSAMADFLSQLLANSRLEAEIAGRPGAADQFSSVANPSLRRQTVSIGRWKRRRYSRTATADVRKKAYLRHIDGSDLR